MIPRFHDFWPASRITKAYLEPRLETLSRSLLGGHVVQTRVLVLHLDDGASGSIEATPVLQNRVRGRRAVGKEFKTRQRCRR
jgi:hypothetical protein